MKILDSFKLLTSTQATLREVDELLRSWKGKEIVYSVCLPAKPQCEPVPGSLSAGVLNVLPVSLPQPAYPRIARAARVAGKVEVKIVIDEEGKVIAAQALRGHPLLQAAAISGARQARFSPMLLNGKSIKIVGVISYTFENR